MNVFTLKRVQQDAVSTRSVLLNAHDDALCEGLEPGYHSPKIAGKTRIPSGTYRLGFRPWSHFDAVYSARVQNVGLKYSGMIEILNVPDFEAVLFHCGNTVADTKACVLVGDAVVSGRDGFMIPSGQSKPAFLRNYPILSAAIDGTGAQLVVVDI